MYPTIHSPAFRQAGGGAIFAWLYIFTAKNIQKNLPVWEVSLVLV